MHACSNWDYSRCMVSDVGYEDLVRCWENVAFWVAFMHEYVLDSRTCASDVEFKTFKARDANTVLLQLILFYSRERLL